MEMHFKATHKTGLRSMDRYNSIDQVRLSNFIVYSYTRIIDDVKMYYGKDSNGDTGFAGSRHREHMAPKWVNKQKVNKEIQKNPDKYYFTIEAICADAAAMNDIEASLIAICKANGECSLNRQEELE